MFQRTLVVQGVIQKQAKQFGVEDIPILVLQLNKQTNPELPTAHATQYQSNKQSNQKTGRAPK